MGSRKLSRNEIESLSGKCIRETNNRVHISIKWTEWLKEFIIGFINQCKFGLYMVFLATIYTHIIRDAFPGRFSEIFLVIAIFQGFNLGTKHNSSLISKILGGLSNSLLSADNDE